MILRKTIYSAVIYSLYINNAYAAGADAIFIVALIPLFFVVIVVMAILDASSKKKSSSTKNSSGNNEHLVVEDTRLEKEIEGQESSSNKNFMLSRRSMVVLIVALHILFPFLLNKFSSNTPSVFNYYYPIFIALFIFYSYTITNHIKSDAVFAYVFSGVTFIALVVIALLSY